MDRNHPRTVHAARSRQGEAMLAWCGKYLLLEERERYTANPRHCDCRSCRQTGVPQDAPRSERMLSEELLDAFNKAESKPQQDSLWALRDKVLALEEGLEQKAEQRACTKLLEILGGGYIPDQPDFGHVEAVVADLKEELDTHRSTVNQIQKICGQAEGPPEDKLDAIGKVLYDA